MNHQSVKTYVGLCTLFCTIIVTGNLIFQKFIILELFHYHWEISVGVLLYPITFLISDLVTEFFGKKNADYMLKMAVGCSLMVMFLMFISDSTTATSWSIVNDEIFHKVFNVYGLATTASIIATYCGQKIDIYLYNYLKQLTDSRHLWLRNNLSTIVGQFIDTITVLTILCSFQIIPWHEFINVGLSTFSFKILAALADTPFCYMGHYLIEKFALKNLS